MILDLQMFQALITRMNSQFDQILKQTKLGEQKFLTYNKGYKIKIFRTNKI